MAFLTRRLCAGKNGFALLQRQTTIALLNAQFSQLSTQDIPKRPKNAYLFFCDEEREKLRADNPSLPMSQIGRKLGEMYNNLPETERTRLEELQKKGWEDYKKTMESMSETRRAEIRTYKRDNLEKKQARRRRIQKLEEERGRPRRPGNPYALFMKENYHKMGEDLSFVEKSMEVKRAWENASEAEKEQYRGMHQQLMQTWKKECEEWKQNQDN